MMKSAGWLVLLSMTAVAGGAGLAADAAPSRIPTIGVAVVDGRCGDWDLANDFFAYMYRAGDSTKVAESRLYLRYDCATGIAFALVLCEPGVIGYADPTQESDAWIALDAHSEKVVSFYSGNDGIPPDFAWVGRGYDGDLNHALGYEASFYASALTYMIFVHIDVWDQQLQTSALVGHPQLGAEVLIPCVPNALRGTSFGAIKALYR